jgi:SNF2 family DNA or RNA helicase
MPDAPDEIALSPHGHLTCPDTGSTLHEAFRLNESAALIQLAGKRRLESGDAPVLGYWRGIAGELIREICHLPEGSGGEVKVPDPAASRLSQWVLNAPPMRGGEYLSPEVLLMIWKRLREWVLSRIGELDDVSAFLEAYAPDWSRVGRVTLHLAENKGDPDYPFAFMASYAAGLSDTGKLRQLPLAKALQVYGNERNKPVLLKLLEPLDRAAKACPFMAELVQGGDVYHPLAWSPGEAHAFLKSVPAYEEAGLVVRLPNWWKKRARRPRVAATIGERRNGALGLGALLDFRLEVIVNGEALSRDELETLLNGDEGLVLFRGQWIEVDKEKLRTALEHWESLEKKGTLSFVEGMRLLAGAADEEAGSGEESEDDPEREWRFARPGKWMAELLEQLREPERNPVPAGLRAQLRPYQEVGLNWLWFCAQTGLGACLADDMGLGKTVQVLAALQRKKETAPSDAPALLIVPASLIGNWKEEAARFAPDLRLHIAHRSENGGETDGPGKKVLKQADLVVTTYGMLTRLRWPMEMEWSWIILDEAQAIKSPASRQSKATRQLRAKARFALTGTPIENNLGDLWSLFDFINPGLLGRRSEFAHFTKSLGGGKGRGKAHYAPLRRLVAPYILRRLKTDKSIISDLPEKTEMKVFCGLTTAQAKLYTQVARQLESELQSADGIQRRGLVLAYLMRFKQVCNHPDQLTQSGGYEAADSAKFQRLSALADELNSRGEKLLVFTQFREMTEPLAAHLATVFGRAGLILHGGSAVKRRQEMVRAFQEEDGPPFFVLSLKAGGTGLNLTAASHVVHFDRWWNPAVENQATDRAFRIGQKRNVVVHKFVTRGTLEEKIDALITEKQDTADAILSDGAERSLTEMSDSELLDFVRLDLNHSQLNS